MTQTAFLAEVTEQTKVIGLHAEPAATKNSFGRLVIRVPDVRKLVKTGYSFYKLPASEILDIWNYVWENTLYFEVAHQALYYYQHKTISKSEFSTIKTWIERCDSWEHSDDLSKIYAQVVEDNPGWILPELKQWNKSPSPWKRRQSVVSLIEYASKRKEVLPYQKLISFVEPLLSDKDYYVQKGVGWTLREIYNVYPTEVLDFLSENLHALTPIAFSSSTEKIAKDVKAELKKRRKEKRLTALSR